MFDNEVTHTAATMTTTKWLDEEHDLIVITVPAGLSGEASNVVRANTTAKGITRLHVSRQSPGSAVPSATQSQSW